MSRIFKTILVDDEQLAIKRLKRLLNKYECIEVLSEASDGKQGLSLADELRPDLIFLDVEMPIMNGFDMLANMSHSPKIIFTTAFEEYAIKAFEENSVDYLLKPIEPERLDKTIEKLLHFHNSATAMKVPPAMGSVLHNAYAKKEVKSVPVKIGDKIIFIRLDQIVYFEAKDKYVYVVTEENREYLTDFTITSLEEKLAGPFLRVHRAFIVNCDKIKELHRGFNSSYILVMKDSRNTHINTGRSYLDHIKQLFEF